MGAAARACAAAAVVAVMLACLPPAAVRATDPRPGAFQLGAWLPHWKKDAGVKRFVQHAAAFSTISPFAFRVQSAERIDDTPRIAREPWPTLRRAARGHGVKVLPSIVWADLEERARTLADPALRARHVQGLLERVERHAFDGLDLDYERKLAAEREGFSRLVTELSEALHARSKILSCTIEPRDREQPRAGVRGRKRSPWVDDYAVLGARCDQIRVMAYDQWALASVGQARHADPAWVKGVARHVATHLPKHKLHLGIPTYGWEFRGRGSHVKKKRALSFGQFQAELARLGLTPEREPRGSLIARAGRRTLVMPDAAAIRSLTGVARDAGLAGVVLFKLDGQTDPAYWKHLKVATTAR